MSKRSRLVSTTAAVVSIGLVPISAQAGQPLSSPAVQAVPGVSSAVEGHASVASSVGAARTAPSATPVRGALVWSAKTCRPDVRDAAQELPSPARVECARLKVPLDHARPSRGTITLMITRVRSSVPSKSTRTLFVNPGGPGVEAGWLAPALAAQLPALHRSHTIVAVDPRGTGGSSPVNCDVVPSGVGEVRSPNSSELAAMRSATAKTVSRCAAAHGSVLPYISTAATVRDHEAVRARLGASSVDWYGVSAGTWLAARYAQAYPRRTGRLVLDSTVDVTSTWRTSFADQPRGFQRRYDSQFLPWVARHHADYGLGATTAKVRASVESLRRQADRGNFGVLAPADIDALIAGGLYDDQMFPERAEDLALLAEGASTKQLKQLEQDAQERDVAPQSGAPQGPLTAEDTVFMAVQCNDSTWSRSQASYTAEGKKLGTAYPLIGWTWSTSPCATWPYRPTPMPPLRANTLPAGLMLQNELDPATPWEGARRVWRAQKNLKVVAVDNEGGHGVLTAANTCAVKAATAYLTRGTLPRADLICAGTPLPDENLTYRVGAVLTPAALS